MTWKEFKEHVDRKLKESGKKEDVNLEHIDVRLPTDVGFIRVNLDEIDNLYISD